MPPAALRTLGQVPLSNRKPGCLLGSLGPPVAPPGSDTMTARTAGSEHVPILGDRPCLGPQCTSVCALWSCAGGHHFPVPRNPAPTLHITTWGPAHLGGTLSPGLSLLPLPSRLTWTAPPAWTWHSLGCCAPRARVGCGPGARAASGCTWGSTRGGVGDRGQQRWKGLSQLPGHLQGQGPWWSCTLAFSLCLLHGAGGLAPLCRWD